METVITEIKATLDDLKLIQNIFEDNPELEHISISFFKNADDGDYNTYIDKITINTTEFVPEYPNEYFDDIEDIMEYTPEPYDCDGVLVDINFITTINEAIWSILGIHSSDSDDIVFERESILALNFRNLNTFL